MREVVITHEPVELYKILKFESLVDSGGQAKTVIADGLVLVNGAVETRKRRKILSGDVIRFAGEELKIRLG
ncbi:MAG: RNA-binding S4 domain-containing protein [Halioglobus sp.]|nr:RNA-binding S4 domain-containing protein [Halioglobus sp.]MBP6723320.1 RNA-binding S4 domain-containing protein [Halioglobus sp.]